MASGDIRGALGLTESEAGSDVQNIQTTATRDGEEEYVLNGSKMFITNGEHGKRRRRSGGEDRSSRGALAIEGSAASWCRKPTHGFSVGQHVDKLGYRGLDTVELGLRQRAGSPPTVW